MSFWECLGASHLSFATTAMAHSLTAGLLMAPTGWLYSPTPTSMATVCPTLRSSTREENYSFSETSGRAPTGSALSRRTWLNAIPQ